LLPENNPIKSCKSSKQEEQSVKSGRDGEVVILTANVKCAVEWYNHTSKLTKFQVIFEVFGKFYSPA
jgi:hypothetical protein